MSFKKYLTGFVMALSVVLSAASLFAADIVGLDTTAGANWRTAANFDSSGGTEYGSDGYIVYGLNQIDGQYDGSYTVADGATHDQSHLPAYITGITRATTGMWSGNGNFGQMQDPDNANALTSVPLLANGAEPQTYTIQRTAGTAFRLTVLVASGDGGNVTHVTTCQDSVDQETQSTNHAANGLHYHVYDVEAGSGDVTVTVNDLNAAYHITGLAFDPPPTVPGALTLSSATVTNITSTNALGGVVLGGTNAYVTLYWGTNNAAKTFTWEATNSTLASSLQATGTLGNVVISNLVADSQYFYIFYASNNVGGLTNWSAINQSFDSGLTGKSVTNLSAAAANPTKIDLTWTDNFNTETGYVIQRSPDGSSWVALTTTASNESSYADSSVSWTNTYHYRIAATNAAGLSAWSTTAQATTPARTNRIDTDFTEATFDDIGILRDIPNSGLASITLDDPNDRLVVATTGGTDMWGSRNNAPIGYILKPTGPLWFMETEIEYATADSGKVFGLTVYSDSDGAKPDFTFGLDRWAGGTGLIKLQGLGDNNPNISVIASNATRVVLRVEAEDDGGGPGFARYTLKYDLLLGGGMRTLTTYDSNFSNARVGLVMKTNAGKTGYVHNLEIDTLIQPVLTNPAVTNITATTALGGVALSGGSAYLTLYWGGSDEGASFTWDETNALPLEQTTGTVNGVAISNLVADTQYFYIFYASNSVSGLTNWSDLSQSFGSALTGKSVTNLSAIASIGQVDLSWTDNFNSETGYVIQRSPDGSSWAALTTVAAGSSGYSDVNVLPLSTYHYRIAATNASGLSDWSTAAQATLPYPPSDNCRITFTNFAGRGTLTNFPALVKLSTNITDFAYDGFLSTNGYDLRFWTNAALTGTEVNYEIEQWSTGDTSHVWVQVPRLTQNSSIWASWGNPAYNSQATYTTDGSVWNTEYQGVWHMNDGTGETVAQDATASNETATLQNMESGTDWVPGNIAGALDFDGANEYLSTALMVAQANSSPPSVTFSAWAYPHTANGNYESVFGTDNGGWDWELGLHSSLKWEIFNGNGQVISTHNATLNDWQHIAAVFDKAAGNVKVYVNGVEQVIAGIGYEAHNPLRIGGMGYGYFDGLIDEARVSHIDRSEDWIWACWMNQGGNHSAFVDYGTVAQADTNLPTLASATVTNITTTNALGGVVLGTTDAYITLYWGESDEGNAFTWALTNSSLASSLQSTGTLSNVAISNLVVDTRYYYVFYASNSVGTVWTAADQSFNSALTGKSVTDLVATAASIPEIDLTWTDNFNTETGYVIQRSPDGSSWAALTTTAADVSSYTDTGLSELSTNHYRIAATNGTGLSDWSSTDVATTPARPNQIDTDFTEADFNDIGIMRDIPNAGLASITLDDTNDRLVFATTGGTDMWGSRNNAPIGYILKPTGPLWFMEAEIEYETAD
ncbi:MAG: hypothetical protein QF878_08040, partial [SAR202 cluster bacterium]|nr:hypothetical protein [SAR202 cluster bacterium]